jgi:hypothetical protein
MTIARRVPAEMLASMKAAVLNAFGSRLNIQNLPDPVLGTGEVSSMSWRRVISYAGAVFNGSSASARGSHR